MPRTEITFSVGLLKLFTVLIHAACRKPQETIYQVVTGETGSKHRIQTHHSCNKEKEVTQFKM
jgi:hypothetical protein